MRIVSIREEAAWLERAIAYFQLHWANEESRRVYEDCLTHAIDAPSPLPQWYLLVEGEEILGCAGLIPNDFISRMDLSPWLCALYIEPAYRGQALGSLLIERIARDCRSFGMTSLYLATDHVGYYEHYGFSYIGTGYHPWGETSRIYERKL